MVCPAPGPDGFDLDSAVLVSPDVLDWDEGRWTSRATGTPWRESLWRTDAGTHVVGLDSGGARSSGLDPDHWRWVSAVRAEDWLRSQDLQEAADRAFTPLPGRPPARLAVVLDHAHRTRLEQLCSDDDLNVQHVLALAVQQYLQRRCSPVGAQGPETGTVPWWPAGVAEDLRPGRAAAAPVVAARPAETPEP